MASLTRAKSLRSSLERKRLRNSLPKLLKPNQRRLNQLRRRQRKVRILKKLQRKKLKLLLQQPKRVKLSHLMLSRK
jgi:hypothetical protein